MTERQVRTQAVGTIEEGSGARRLEPRGVYGSYLTRGLLIGGLVLFVVLVWRIGPSSIGDLLWKVGWALPLVFVPYGLVIAFETLGWWFAFPSNPRPIGLNDILRYTVSAKAVQLVTPSISQAGEFVKIHLLRMAGVNSDVSTASVVVAKTTITQVWSVIVTRLTAFVPGNLGTQEAGMVVIFSFLGLTPESGMAFALLRRIRQIGWIASGFGLLAKMSRG